MSATDRGIFLTLEGGEGAGKSTNLEFIARYLLDRGIDLVQTREPGGTPLAEEIRGLLLAPREEAVGAMTELLLMFAARSQHLQQIILPAVESGRWVLCDRFTDASFAYQGGGRGLPFEQIESLEHLVQGTCRPDVTLLLDLPVELGLQRVGRRGVSDRFESEQSAFFERIRAVYLKRAQMHAERYAVIDASRPLADVQERIACELDSLLAKFGVSS